MASVSLRIPYDVAAHLHRLAEFTGRSKTFYMIEATNWHFNELKDLSLSKPSSS